MDNKVIFGIAFGVVFIGIGSLCFLKKEKKEKKDNSKIFYEVLKLSDVIGLVNENYSKSDLKEDEVIVLIHQNGSYILSIYSEKTSTILETSTLIINCSMLDENLAIAFSGKDMIVLEV